MKNFSAAPESFKIGFLILDKRLDPIDIFKPLKDKKLRVLIIDKGFKNPIISEQTQEEASGDSNSLETLSELENLIFTLAKRFKPDFATEDIGTRTEEEFFDKNVFSKLFLELGVPFIPRRGSTLDYACSIKKDEVRCMYLCDTEFVEDLAILFDSLGADVSIARLQKRPASSQSQMIIRSKTLRKNICAVVKGMAGNTPYTLSFLKPPYILLILGADGVEEPITRLGYEAGFDIVFSYNNLTPKDIEQVIARVTLDGSNGSERTCILVCARNMMEASKFLEVLNQTLNQVPIVLDPGGKYTTAVSMVAKVKDFLSERRFNKLIGRRCAVFGNDITAKIVAILLYKLGCQVTLVNPCPNVDPETEEPSHLTKYMAFIESILAPTTEDQLEVLRKSNIVFITVPLENRITLGMLRRLRFFTIIVDVSTSSPTNVEGLEADDDMKEIIPGIYGLGGLALRRARDSTLVELLRSIRLNRRSTLDYPLMSEMAESAIKKVKISPSKRDD
ncbi:MAG: hypothetical protein DRO00_05065 [Thermoproteota archaeon]|nr:MAG: hypothetical protein DRO00_05065 [Candidatus Korarchaeota archaeon]